MHRGAASPNGAPQTDAPPIPRNRSLLQSMWKHKDADFRIPEENGTASVHLHNGWMPRPPLSAPCRPQWSWPPDTEPPPWWNRLHINRKAEVQNPAGQRTMLSADSEDLPQRENPVSSGLSAAHPAKRPEMCVSGIRFPPVPSCPFRTCHLLPPD